MAVLMSGSMAGARPCTALYGGLPFTEMNALPANPRSDKICSKGKFKPSCLSCSTVRWITSRRRAVLRSM
eukprot:1407973-Alexandrium_andersonii.AAC.1